MCNVRGSVGCSGITWSNRNGHFDVLAEKEITAKLTEQSKQCGYVYFMEVTTEWVVCPKKKLGGGGLLTFCAF